MDSLLSTLAALAGANGCTSASFGLLRATSFIFLGSTLLLMGGNVLTVPITCSNSTGAATVPEAALNSHCWSRAGFQLSELGGPEFFNLHQALPGLYMVQAVLLFVPFQVWRWREGGFVALVIIGLNKEKDASHKKVSSSGRKVLSLRRRHGRLWLDHLVCELAVGGLLAAQLAAANALLGGTWPLWDLGLADLANSFREQEDRTDPIIGLFPRDVYCQYARSLAKCSLPLNPHLERIFLVTRAWLFAATLLAALAFSRLAYFTASPSARIAHIRRRMSPFSSSVSVLRCAFGPSGGVGWSFSERTGELLFLQLVLDNLGAFAAHDLMLFLHHHPAEAPRHHYHCQPAEEANGKDWRGEAQQGEKGPSRV